CQDFLKIDGVRRRSSFLKTIQVDVIEQQPASMRIDERERMTGDVFFINAQCLGDTFHENGFARAKRTAKQKNLAAGKLLADTHAEIERLALFTRNEIANRN